MRVFVDTSAFLAFLNADDKNFLEARRLWTRLLEQKSLLLCTNYVLLETLALVQRRLGLEAVRAFQDVVVPLLVIEWVEEQLHREGILAVLAANRRRLSLVDCTSFIVARRLDVDRIFAFDAHFGEQGFQVLR